MMYKINISDNNIVRYRKVEVEDVTEPIGCINTNCLDKDECHECIFNKNTLYLSELLTRIR